MDIDGSFYFTEEMEDLVLASSPDSLSPPHLRDRSPDEDEPMEGETLPESALNAIRSWFGF